MNSKRETKSHTVLGWILSIAVHTAVAILFLFLYVEFTETGEEYSEVSFISVASTEIQNIGQSRSLPSQSQRQNTAVDRNARIVELPQRSMQENEKPTLLEDVKDKVPITSDIRKTGQRVDPLTGLARDLRDKTDARLPGEKDIRGSRKIDVGQKVTTDIPTEGLGGQGAVKKPYDIVWEGGDREVLADPLPEYPENVDKEVVLKMQINVMPDGTMGKVLPLQKGNAKLESLTIQALKKWRFNPLEPSAPQVPQKGTITFRFVLK